VLRKRKKLPGMAGVVESIFVLSNRVALVRLNSTETEGISGAEGRLSEI